MSITHIDSVSQLNGILSKSKDKVSVIDFHATWCGPCHAIAPTFESLSKEYKNVNFLKCDVDAAKDVASLYKVSAMPTFVFLRGETKIDQVRGADRAALSATVKKHAASSSSGSGAFTGKGHTLGGDSAPLRPQEVAGDVRRGLGNATQSFEATFSPQTRVLLYLLGAYALFWYMSS
ncbi:thioredoxin-domain-containing protein [Dendrothele bispora CBS 962.96]|uniref:Thioredoxin n=1 Tax=Dendrothele bispora (strain CBS 962.96) TaxID=1314807 RepID=A0A4S8MXP6_DENBC|nr:thioredoxin-domain-containing protein [Dendrothele bispora CBS 962.96]